MTKHTYFVYNKFTGIMIDSGFDSIVEAKKTAAVFGTDYEVGKDDNYDKSRIRVKTKSIQQEDDLCDDSLGYYQYDD